MNDPYGGLFEGCAEITASQDAPQELLQIPAARGVLFFASDRLEPVQLLSAGSMRAAARARLAPQQEPSKRRADLSEIIARVYWTTTWCEMRTAISYARLARRIYPRNWREILSPPRISLVRIDLSAALPDFQAASSRSPREALRYFGPFPGHKSALQFARSLNQAFMLCRNPVLAADPAKAASCPYRQMGTCPAACLEEGLRTEYMQRVQAAIEVAATGPQQQIDALTQAMTDLAARRRFEEANAAKLSIQSLTTLLDDACRWTRDLDELAILHVDRSAKVKTEGSRKLVQQYAGFLIRPGHIAELPDAPADDLQTMAAAVEEAMACDIFASSADFTESLALAASFLYRSNPPGVFLDARTGLSAENIRNALTERFSDEKTAGT